MAFGVASRRWIHTGARRRIFAESALVRLKVITISRHEQENTYRCAKKQQVERCYAAKREEKCTQMESKPLHFYQIRKPPRGNISCWWFLIFDVKTVSSIYPWDRGDLDCFAFQAAILFASSVINPDSRPFDIYETRMAARAGKRSILTILRKSRGLWTVYLICDDLFYFVCP